MFLFIYLWLDWWLFLDRVLALYLLGEFGTHQNHQAPPTPDTKSLSMSPTLVFRKVEVSQDSQSYGKSRLEQLMIRRVESNSLGVWCISLSCVSDAITATKRTQYSCSRRETALNLTNTILRTALRITLFTHNDLYLSGHQNNYSLLYPYSCKQTFKIVNKETLQTHDGILSSENMQSFVSIKKLEDRPWLLNPENGMMFDSEELK